MLLIRLTSGIKRIENRSSEFKETSIKLIQFDKQIIHLKKMKKDCRMYGTLTKYTMFDQSFRKRSESGDKRIFENIMAENFLNSENYINLQIENRKMT